MNKQQKHIYLDIDVDVSAAGVAARSAGSDNTRTKQYHLYPGLRILFLSDPYLGKGRIPNPDVKGKSGAIFEIPFISC